MTDGEMYLGRHYDPKTKQTTEKPFSYDPGDLTTHAVVTGMTGSGKTGLCIALLEEAALKGIPALIIDPKGDLTNLLLHFPDLAASDFQPWIDPEVARRAGKTLEGSAEEASSAWQEGLKEWGIDKERLIALKNAAQYAIFTPGSKSGLLIRALSALALPNEDELADREILIDKITSTVTALLGLVGIKEIDPLRSREHILLSKLIENTWKLKKNVDLTELILQVQDPPFEKLGAFGIETFFPAKERMDLAIQLNNILASPSFQGWREGHDLDIPSLLHMPDGQPRHSVFYLAHLAESERMFFVTLLISEIESWMRTQSGATTLRAILYMDELFGYLPPQSNPPSKEPLLRMLKQARAYGLGLLLATQNPVDLDYKALSNAGTWFIGKLQTERDKNRLLDGLEGAAGGASRSTIDKLISRLGKRVFLGHNVHEVHPSLFKSRWAMNFLAGPLTRVQISDANKLVGADQLAVSTSEAESGSQTDASPEDPTGADSSEPAPAPAPMSSELGSATRPKVPASIEEHFLPTNLSLTEAARAQGNSVPDAKYEGVLYRPALLASANVRFLNRKYGVDTETVQTILVQNPDSRGVVRWGEHCYKDFPLREVERTPVTGARYGSLHAPLNVSKQMTAMKRDFIDWIYHSLTVDVRENKALKVYSGPDESQADFMKSCAQAARAAADAEIEKVSAQFERKLKALEDKISREERELREDESELSHRKMEEMGTHAENVLGLFGGRKSSRRLSTSLRKRRMTEQAKSDVEESHDALDDYNRQLEDMQAERVRAIEEIEDRWGDVVNDVSEVTLPPMKKDIYLEVFGVAWMPFYLVERGGKLVELPAFGNE